MKKLFIALMVALTALSITITEAEAKRMGGGGSIGRQSQSVTRQAPAQSSNQMSNANQARPAAPAATPQTVPPKPASPWRNILGGALLGLGLGALLSHFGLGGAFASMIGTILTIALVALAAMFIYRMFRRKSTEGNAQPAYAGAYGANRTPEIGSRIEPSAPPAALQSEAPVAGSADIGNKPWGIPADFDVEGFLRHAKTYFIRLQAAWDKADINDIREFTTPEMFAELRQELLERGTSPNVTDVVKLDAELLGVETVGNEYVASVKFSGLIKEAENAPAEPFVEVWNLVKPVSGPGGWILAGIQQLSEAR
jgi:predicted lipid-binding transport protein (Tim44 family)